MNYLIILLISLCFSTSGLAQIEWNVTSDSSLYTPEDYVMDKNGNLFLSVKGNDLIFHCNVFDVPLKFAKLPKVLNRYFFPDRHVCNLFLDFADTLIALTASGPYRYLGDKFLLDTIGRIDTNYLPSWSYSMKYNLKGDLFGSFLDVIFQYKDKWKNDRNNVVFNPGRLIYNYFPFDEENNFALIGDNDGRNLSVVRFNTDSPEVKEIFTSNAVSNWRDVFVTKDGHIFAGSFLGLLHSYNEGKNLENVLIDTALGNTPVRHVYQSKSGDAIMVQLTSGFFCSYDLGKTWLKLHLFSHKIPQDPVFVWEKMDFIDTAHAVLLITDDCYKIRTFLLTPEQGEWKQLNPSTFKMNAFHLIKNKKQRMFVQNDLCDWIYSDDDGNQFKVVLKNGQPVRELGLDSQDQLYCFYPEKTDAQALYWSKNDGQDWDTNHIFPGKVLAFYTFRDGSLMLLTQTPNNNRSIPYYVYYSTNHGQSWELQNNRFSPPNEVYQILKSPDGSIYAFLSGTRTVMISQDLGKTWQADRRFEKISSLGPMVFDEQGYFIFGGTVEGVYGIYRTTNLMQFEHITQNGPTDVQALYSPVGGVIVATFARSGVYITYDYGLNWINITSNLEFDISNRGYKINSIFVDDQGRIFLARLYDGINRTNSMAVSVDDPKLSQIEAFSFSPNPTVFGINIQLNESVMIHNPTLVISNALGQIILRKKVVATSDAIDLKLIPKGIYYLSLTTEKGAIRTEKIIKL